MGGYFWIPSSKPLPWLWSKAMHSGVPRSAKYQEGLTPARIRRITEFVNSKIDEELTLGEMAQSVELSKAHFSRMFHKSTGESPYQFVLRHRVEHAKVLLRVANSRILDVAVACGFKTQQHFARVFRHMCGVSPTEYRHEFLRHGANCNCEICSHATSTLLPPLPMPNNDNPSNTR
jgi:transcriptional regulator GlxA family with amidase domain